jgi:hypothetical protein
MTERKNDRLDLLMAYTLIPLFEDMEIKKPFWIEYNPFISLIPFIWTLRECCRKLRGKPNYIDKIGEQKNGCK